MSEETNFELPTLLTKSWKSVCFGVLSAYTILHAVLLAIGNFNNAPVCNLSYSVFSPWTRDFRIFYAASFVTSSCLQIARIIICRYTDDKYTGAKGAHYACFFVQFISALSSLSSWIYEFGGVCEDIYG